MNPARKQKPSAPKLDYDTPLSPSIINTSDHAAIDTNIERLKLPEESSDLSDAGLKKKINKYVISKKKNLKQKITFRIGH